jgi:hypothetical protein
MPAGVFRARREMPAEGPTEITIGDSVIMIRDGGGSRGGRPTFLSARWRISAGPINAPRKQAVLRLRDPPTGAHCASPWGETAKLRRMSAHSLDLRRGSGEDAIRRSALVIIVQHHAGRPMIDGPFISMSGIQTGTSFGHHGSRPRSHLPQHRRQDRVATVRMFSKGCSGRRHVDPVIVADRTNQPESHRPLASASSAPLSGRVKYPLSVSDTAKHES